MKETWLPYYIGTEFTGYFVSSTGKVSNSKDLILKPEIRAGYYSVNLYFNGKKKKRMIHRMVAEMFIPAHMVGEEHVNHKDGVKTHNWVSNLEWCTPSYNSKHAFTMGLRKNKSGSESHLSKYTEEQVLLVCELLMENTNINHIVEQTGISDKNIYLIRDKKIWKELTSSYNFPKSKFHNSKYNSKVKEKIIELLLAGNPNSVIYKELGLECNKSTQDLIYRCKRYIKNNIQGSTTIERVS